MDWMLFADTAAEAAADMPDITDWRYWADYGLSTLLLFVFLVCSFGALWKASKWLGREVLVPIKNSTVSLMGKLEGQQDEILKQQQRQTAQTDMILTTLSTLTEAVRENTRVVGEFGRRSGIPHHPVETAAYPPRGS